MKKVKKSKFTIRLFGFVLALMIVSSLSCNVMAADEAEESEKEYAKIYETAQVVLRDLKVYEKVNNERIPLTKSVKFIFYNVTSQEYEQSVYSENGSIPDVTLVKNNNYIIFAEDREYKMENAYITLQKDGGVLQNYKEYGKTIEALDLIKRERAVEDPADANRVKVKISVYYKDDTGRNSVIPDVAFTLISEFETVKATTDTGGFITVTLLEDVNYMVNVESDTYAMDSFPLSVKDKSEWDAGKYAHNHMNCDNVLSLIIFAKAKEHKNDTTIYSHDQNVSLTGLNFGKNHKYILNERVLSGQTVPGLEGKDYEIVDIDLINMSRIEISKLVEGNFKVTRRVPAGKSVKQVYYTDKEGVLVKLPFTQKKLSGNQRSVTFEMPCMSMYDNVIEYEALNETPVKVKALGKTQIVSAKNSKKKAITVQIKRIKSVAGYRYQYSLNNKFKKAKSKNSTGTKITFGKLKKKKTYYVRVQAYRMDGKKKIYGTWSSVKKVKVKK